MASDPVCGVIIGLFSHKNLHALIMVLDIGLKVAKRANIAEAASDPERHAATGNDSVIIGALIRVIGLLLCWLEASVATAFAGTGTTNSVGTGKGGRVESRRSVVDALVADTPFLIEVDTAARRGGRAQFHAFFQGRKDVLGEDLCSMALPAVHTERLCAL